MCNGCVYLRTSYDLSTLDDNSEKFKVSCIRYGLKLSGSYTKEELQNGINMFADCPSKDTLDEKPSQLNDVIKEFTDELYDE